MISRRTGIGLLVVAGVVLSIGAIWWMTYSQNLPPGRFREIGRISAGTAGVLGVDDQSGLVYVASGDEPSRITIIDGDQERLVASTTSGYAQQIAVDSVHHWAYVLNYATNDVTVVGADGSAVSLPIGGDDAADIAIDEVKGLAYVVSPWAKATGRTVIEGRVTVFQGPQIVDEWVFPDLQLYRVAFDPIGRLLYLSDIWGTIIVIQDATEIARFNLTTAPPGTEGVISLVTNTSTGDVYGLTYGGVVQIRNGSRVQEYAPHRLDEVPYRWLIVHPSSNELLLAAGNSVVVLREMQAVARIVVGISPRRLAVDDETGQVFVADYAGQSLSIIEDDAVTQSIPLEALPYSIVYNPTHDLLYVFEEETRQVAIYGRGDE